MRYISFIILSMLLIVLSGCTASHKGVNPVSLQDGEKSSYPLSEESISNASENLSVADGNELQALPDQDRIDQALELCSQSQSMWKKGDLDQALADLDSAYSLILEVPAQGQPPLDQQKDDLRFLISKRILEIYASRQVTTSGGYDEIPIILNDHVKAEIKRLTGRERKFFIRALERSYRYRPYIVEALRKEGMPEEISWLPLIESGFKIKALSPARALGLWQFIPSTGNKFGLSRNRYVDERMDPEKATMAAIDYLKELHGLFGDWTTALAAYNCGEGRVLKTIRRQKLNYLDNFWDLYMQLPSETARYVPRFLATVHIIRNLEKYNIKVQNPLSPIAYKKVEVNKRLRLSDISKATGISLSSLKDLNPELRYSILPPDPYDLKIPLEHFNGFLASIKSVKPTSHDPGPTYVYHRVRKGETLSGIARRYKSSVRTIARANRISSKSRIYVGKVLKVPNSYRYSAPSKYNRVAKRNQKIRYRVKKGDNLWSIAKKMSTKPKRIMSDNNLSDTKLKVGQILTISAHNKSSIRTYRVKSGDSPFIIAKRHNMSLKHFLSLNRLSKRSKIYPGQSLKLE